MASPTHGPSHAHSPAARSPAFHSSLSTTAVDPTASGLARWLTQRPREESWNALDLSEKQPAADTPGCGPREAGWDIKDRDGGVRL